MMPRTATTSARRHTGARACTVGPASRPLRALVPLVIAAMLAAPAAASQSPSPPELAGRWHDESGGVTLDIALCGEAWCGVEVRGASCGARVLRIAVARPASTPQWFEGRLDFAEPNRRFAVRATLRDGVMLVMGDDQTPAFLRRSMPPLELQLARTGPAQCPAEPRTS